MTFVDATGLEHAVALVETLVPGARDGWAWGRELHEALAEGRAVEGWGEALGAMTADAPRRPLGLARREGGDRRGS